MRILLDENLDWRLSRSLPDHEVDSVPLIGWAGTKNGALLARASTLYDAFVTMDTAMVTQHDFSGLPYVVIILRARSNRLADTAPLMPKVLSVLPTSTPGQIVVIE